MDIVKPSVVNDHGKIHSSAISTNGKESLIISVLTNPLITHKKGSTPEAG